MVVHRNQRQETRITFEYWLSALDKIAGSAYGEGRCSENTGQECWRSYYDLGYSPQAAFDEDQSYD